MKAAVEAFLNDAWEKLKAARYPILVRGRYPS